jgi:hypothetical protein
VKTFLGPLGGCHNMGKFLYKNVNSKWLVMKKGTLQFDLDNNGTLMGNNRGLIIDNKLVIKNDKGQQTKRAMKDDNNKK